MPSSQPVLSPEAQGLYLPAATPLAKQHELVSIANYFVSELLLVVLYFGMLRSRYSARIRDWSARFVRPWPVQLAIYLLAITLIVSVALFPLSLTGGWLIPRHFHLSHQSIANWFGDWAKGVAVDYAVSVPVVWAVFALIRRFRRWWIPVWALLVLVIFLSVVIEPLMIDPLFNRYQPFPQGPLRDRIEALATRAGVPNTPVFQVDKSKQTTTANAYVTGLFGSARIVIWDTTVQKLPANQVVAIVGHEMGHYVEGHIWVGCALSAFGLLFALPVGQWMLDRILKNQGQRWGLNGSGDIAVYPLIALFISVGMLAAMPITNFLSRKIEHRADVFGIRITGDRQAMARALIELSQQNLSDPDPPRWLVYCLYSHPPMRERIEFVLQRPVLTQPESVPKITDGAK